MDENKIIEVLNWAYDKSINGATGLDSAQELAEDYLTGEGKLKDKVDALIRWQNTKCFTSGFITGLGGIITLPVSVPANIASVLYVQVRMVATIAYMGGYDVKDDKVKTLVFICLCGDSATQLIKDVGIAIDKKLTEQAIKKISAELIAKINKAVGFRLLTKFGQKGVINLGKAVPVIGGALAGTIDAVATNTIGNVARDTFIND